MEHGPRAIEDPSALLARTEPEDVARVARKLFFAIAKDWQLQLAEQAHLLGFTDVTSFSNDFVAAGSAVSDTVLLRISHLLNIQHCILTLTPMGSSHGAWIRRSNRHLAGKSVLEVMLLDGDGGIEFIHEYLGAQVHM